VGALDEAPAGLHCGPSDLEPAGLLTFQVEMYGRTSGKLIAASRGKELLAIPRSKQSLKVEVTQLLQRYGARSAVTPLHGPWAEGSAGATE
jgi:hypothetical protein